MIEGRVWKFGDHINTDLIIPGRCLDDYSPENLAAHVLEDADPQFAKQVRQFRAGRRSGSGHRFSPGLWPHARSHRFRHLFR